MRYTRFVLYALLLFVSAASVRATELYDRLMALERVTSVEELPKGFFAERYVVTFEQWLDGKSPARGKFEQRVVVAHAGFDRTTLLVTEGYGGSRALNERYREEISQRLGSNQVFVEHRYFGESVPDPCRWEYLTAEAAAADLHAVREAMGSFYRERWIASGISKGGENALIYQMYYPADVDAVVAYVAPVCFGVEDPRSIDFLEGQVGTSEQRALVREFQREVLSRREHLVPLLSEYCDLHGYDFDVSIDEAFDFMVLEYGFALWQWGTAPAVIPESDSPHEELFDHLVAVSMPSYFAKSSSAELRPFFVQASRELGYYAYDVRPFEGLLKLATTKGYVSRVFLPADQGKIRYSDQLSRRLAAYYRANDPRVLVLYGANDPWTSMGLGEEFFEGKQQMRRVVVPEGSHRSRLRNLDASEQEELWNRLESWVLFPSQPAQTSGKP